jgi:exosortase
VKKVFYPEAILICLFTFLLFLPIYSHLLGRFGARESYYSHGYLVPFVIAYLVFRKQNRLKEIEALGIFSGLIILLTGIVLYLASLFLKSNFTAYLSLPLVILGVLLYLKGKKFTKELLFPLAFLFFMLPLPEFMIIGISFKLKILAAQLATNLGNLIGIKAILSGSTIFYPGGTLLVGDPCSGLRSLITFLALGALFTQFTKASSIQKVSLFLSAIPIAIISNLLRLTFLLLVGFVYGQEAITGLVHDISGYLVFVLGFLGLILASKILKCKLAVENI